MGGMRVTFIWRDLPPPWQLDAKLSEERLFCHSRAGGNPEVFDFLVSEFLGFRLRGSDEPFCINLLAFPHK